MARLRGFNFVILLLLVLALVVTFTTYRRIGDEGKNLLYVIPLKGTISGGTADFISRALNEAEERKAEAALIELKTFGGGIDAMTEIADVISASDLPIYVFVEGRAISAGAYIALSAERIVMSPEAVMGASQPRTVDGEPVPEKEMAAMRKMFRGAAEARAQRTGVALDPKVAEAMVDPEVEVEGVVREGELLALTAEEALELGYADFIAKNRNEAIVKLGLDELIPVAVKQTPVEGLVRFLTDPFISPLLLTIGFTALIIEVFTAGFGAAGIIGVTSLLLFFGARILSGLAGVEVILLFLLGIVLLAAEAFVIPGFGVAGIMGLTSIGGSIVLSYATSGQGIAALGTSAVWSFFLASVAFQFLRRSGFLDRIVLHTSQTGESGYSAVPSYTNYLGATAVVINPLRPAGVAEFPDGERLDVVSEGAYIEAGHKVKVVKVEGRRIVVRAMSD